MTRGGAAVLGFSALLHGGLWLGVLGIEPPPPPAPPPVKISMRAPPPEVKQPEVTPPEPEVAEPEIAEPTVAPELPPPPTPAPKQAARPKPRPEPAPASPAAAEVPDFGVALGNGGSGPGGVAVPVGDPGGAPGGGGKREKVESKTRKLEAKARPADDGCSEAEVKPSPLELPQPAYTESARAAGIVGKVRVQLTVAVDGSVQAATVVSSLDPGLDAAALAAVKSAKFRPATRCGKPVAATITIGIKFSL